VKNRLKAKLAPKSGENGLFFEKNRHIESILKFLVESVTTGLPVGDSFNGQILKYSPFMSHFDFGFSQPLLQRRFEKKPCSICDPEHYEMKESQNMPICSCRFAQ